MDSEEMFSYGDQYQALASGAKNMVTLYYCCLFFLGMTLLGWKGVKHDFPRLEPEKDEEVVNVVNSMGVTFWLFLHYKLRNNLDTESRAFVEEMGTFDYDFDGDFPFNYKQDLLITIDKIHKRRIMEMGWGRLMVTTSFYFLKSSLEGITNIVKINEVLAKNFPILCDLMLKLVPLFKIRGSENFQTFTETILDYFTGVPLFFSPYFVSMLETTFDGKLDFSEETPEVSDLEPYATLLFQPDEDGEFGVGNPED